MAFPPSDEDYDEPNDDDIDSFLSPVTIIIVVLALVALGVIFLLA